MTRRWLAGVVVVLTVGGCNFEFRFDDATADTADATTQASDVAGSEADGVVADSDADRPDALPTGLDDGGRPVEAGPVVVPPDGAPPDVIVPVDTLPPVVDTEPRVDSDPRPDTTAPADAKGTP